MPRVFKLADSLELEHAFGSVSDWPHRLWFDSAADRNLDRGRYSFLSADPVAWDIFPISAADPWPLLSRWADRLAMVDRRVRDSARWAGDLAKTLPPFWGGIAGLWTYEAGCWLEPSLGRPAPPPWLDQAPELPAIAVGVYDWVISVDHQAGQTLLISTGLTADWTLDDSAARLRESEVIRRLDDTQQSARRGHPGQQRDDAGAAGRGTCDHVTNAAEVTSNFSDEGYRSAVAEIVRRIRQGDSFQVNLAQTLGCPATCSPEQLYRALRDHNPAPYACFLDLGDPGGPPSCVLSSSPEGFLQVRDGYVVTRPIKGTVPRTGDEAVDDQYAAELIASEKDRAENLMIVDLMRNDLSRVCSDESVEVLGVCQLERFQRVQHLVSTVCGRLRRDKNVIDLLAACFPGGSITGAPKLEAMRTIRSLEPNRRGPYCGSMGYLSLSGDADFNILIRTLTQHGGRWWLPVGGGITARSNPAKETEETWAKADGMLQAIRAAVE